MIWWYQCVFDFIVHTEVFKVLCSKLWPIVTDYLFRQSKAGKNIQRASTIVLVVAERKDIASIHFEWLLMITST